LADDLEVLGGCGGLGWGGCDGGKHVW
jgi:hypothetical protein